ncbi:MAG: fibronectin type III domain-containing protein, partial [Candidatus Omnitrophota bacterium]
RGKKGKRLKNTFGNPHYTMVLKVEGRSKVGVSGNRWYIRVSEFREGHAVFAGGSPSSIIFTRLNTPPAIPTELTATASGLTVVLTWTDNSTDETGFKISRKDTLEGEFAEIGTTSADTTTYTDTLTQSGTYWYRVMATNANGDSLGSNEAMVTVSE